MKKPSKPRKRRVIFLEATESRLWVYELIKKRAKASGNSVAAEAYGILAAYLIKSHDPEEIMKIKREFPPKRVGRGKAYPGWRF